jgi:hypothetical protein
MAPVLVQTPTPLRAGLPSLFGAELLVEEFSPPGGNFVLQLDDTIPSG